MSFLLGFEMHPCGFQQGKASASSPHSVCVEALSRELTGVTGEGDSLATARLQWTAAGWQCGNPGRRGSVRACPPTVVFQGSAPTPLPSLCLVPLAPRRSPLSCS